MRLASSRLPAVAASVGCVLILSSCGSPGLGSSDKSEIRAALARFTAARTPIQACAVMSSGFRFFVGKGDYFGCAKRFVGTVGRLTPGVPVVERMAEQSGQVAVNATVTQAAAGGHKLAVRQPTTFWFVKQRGRWRLNSIGYREGLGPPPPGAPGTPPLKR